MDNSVVKPVNPNDLVLDIVGRKYVSGSSLTTAEELMALSASAGEMAKNYGPGPAEDGVEEAGTAGKRQRDTGRTRRVSFLSKALLPVGAGWPQGPEGNVWPLLAVTR